MSSVAREVGLSGMRERPRGSCGTSSCGVGRMGRHPGLELKLKSLSRRDPSNGSSGDRDERDRESGLLIGLTWPETFYLGEIEGGGVRIQ